MNWCMNNEMAIYIGYGRKRNSGLDIKCHNVIIVLDLSPTICTRESN